jgi:hypothetical protein
MDEDGNMDDRGDGRNGYRGRGSAGLPCPARIW